MESDTRDGAMKKQRGKLTDKQQAFVEYYCGEANWNATKAAIMAGYSANCARYTGCTSLTKPNVKAAIDKKRAELTARADVKAEQLVQEYMKIGFSNIQDYLADCNNIEDIKKIDRNQAAAVESIQIDIRHDKGDSKGYTEKIKLKLYNCLLYTSPSPRD